MSKLRPVARAIITISCDGPEHPTIRPGLLGIRRSRSGCDLQFTTSDCDWFYSHFAKKSDASSPTKHTRLVNPTRQELYRAIASAGEFLRSKVCTPSRHHGGITFIYAGHGRDGSGAWCLKDGDVPALTLSNKVVDAMDPNQLPCRVELVMDSCFAGAFFAEFLSYSLSQQPERVLLGTAFGAALSNEVAWEYGAHGHGVFTYAFKAMFEQLVLGQASLPRHGQIGVRDTDRFRSGGVSWLTDDEQHAFEYERGRVEVIGAGTVALYSDTCFTGAQIRQLMGEALEAMPGTIREA